MTAYPPAWPPTPAATERVHPRLPVSSQRQGWFPLDLQQHAFFFNNTRTNHNTTLLPLAMYFRLTTIRSLPSVTCPHMSLTGCHSAKLSPCRSCFDRQEQTGLTGFWTLRRKILSTWRLDILQSHR